MGGIETGTGDPLTAFQAWEHPPDPDSNDLHPVQRTEIRTRQLRLIRERRSVVTVTGVLGYKKMGKYRRARPGLDSQ